MDKRYPWYVCMVDKFMSGWGGAAGGRSRYALACETYAEALIVAENARRRSEMFYVHINAKPPRKRSSGDHISVQTRDTASAWYQPGAWKD